jgi:hypothetical protein
MPTVLLIEGKGGAGKSWLGTALEGRGWLKVCLDTEYVEFIRVRYPHLHFPLIGAFIDQHYGRVVCSEDRLKRYFDHSVRDAWHGHTLDTVARAVDAQPKVAVVGGLLFDCKDRLTDALRPRASVHWIEVVKDHGGDRRVYRLSSGRDLTLDEVAALG